MKTSGMLTIAVLVISGGIASYGQALEAEVPGDNFSLEGALELFKKSASPEEFEKLLNSPESKVNNLDLNGDGYIDYVRVHDLYKGNVHAFVLQAVVSEDELQDIAVIELEKLSDGRAVLQIIGDADIYGVTTIIEPTTEVRTYAGTQTTRTVVNVWTWPSVRYIYSPHYTVWVSPWGWHHHPVWWTHWRPVAYVHYYPIWRPYHHHYVVCHTRRIVHAHDIYRPYRRTSVIVYKTHHDRIARYRSSYPNGRRSDDRREYTRDDRSRSRIEQPRVNEQRTRTENNGSRTMERSNYERSTAPQRQRAVSAPQDSWTRRAEPEVKTERRAPSPVDMGKPSTVKPQRGSTYTPPQAQPERRSTTAKSTRESTGSATTAPRREMRPSDHAKQPTQRTPRRSDNPPTRSLDPR